MIQVIGVLCVIAIFSGGAYVETGQMALGLACTASGVIGLGALIAAIQSASEHGPAFETRDGLTVRQLKKFITEVPWITDDTKVYVGDTGLNPAGSVFSCLMDGGKTLVIERKAEPGTPAAEHDLF